MSRATVVIISDLHIGAGKLDDFEPEIEREFVRFVREIAAWREPVELVINGDLLDFVQAPPATGKDDGGVPLEGEAVTKTPLCFTSGQSETKFSANSSGRSING